MTSKSSHEIVSALLSLYYHEIISLAEYQVLVEKIIPHPNFGYFCGDEMQTSIDEFFNSKDTKEHFLDLAHYRTQVNFYGNKKE